MRQITILLLLAASASAQITAKYQHSDQTVKIYSQAGHVWLYVVDGVNVVAGCEQFNELAKGRLVDWEKAAVKTLQKMKKCNGNGNGKAKVKIQNKEGKIFEYENISCEVLQHFLECGCKVEANTTGNSGRNDLGKK